MILSDFGRELYTYIILYSSKDIFVKGICWVALCVTLPFSTQAQSLRHLMSDTLDPVRKELHLAVGHANVLDTYLSPITHAGPAVGILHRAERLARWGAGKVSVQGFYSGNVGLLESVADRGRAYSGDLTAAVAWHYNFHLLSKTRLAVGGMGEVDLGFTYLTRGGNNPAQGRAGVNLGLSLIAEQPFHLWGREWSASAQLDLPLVGARFTPNYGQSYYEIFSLGNYNKNIQFTHPINAPSARLFTQISIPLGRAKLSLGYWGDIRQSELHHLKRHSWNHYFTIGYVRHLAILR